MNPVLKKTPRRRLLGDPKPLGAPVWMRPEGALDCFRKPLAPRPGQVTAIRKIIEHFLAGKRVVVVEAPTGVGKSDIALAVAQYFRANGKRSHVLTSQRILQDQYQADFPAPVMELIKGRNAYPCNHPDAKPGDNAAYAPCTRMGKSILGACCASLETGPKRVVALAAQPQETNCPYWKQLLVADRAPITLYNFSSFLFQQRIGRFGKRDLLIVDECHGTEAQLLNFVELSITSRQLEPIGETIPAGVKTPEQVQAWLRGGLLAKVEAAARDENNRPPQEREQLERLQAKLETFLEYFDRTEWLVENKPVEKNKGQGPGEEGPRRLECRPVYAADFADDLLFSKATRVLAVSATILNKDIWARNLGLSPQEVGFVQLGSDFPVANRPIQQVYLGNMNYENKDRTIPKLIHWIKNELLPRHAGERGIIHAHSFSLANAIIAGVGSPRLLLHEPGVDKREVLARHAARADSVIVAPGMAEGVDLKDGLARFQVLAKAPYPSLNDPVIKRRMERQEGREWYLWLTMIKFCQSSGRSVRSKSDHAVTYLTDSGFAGLLGRGRRLLPGWVREALV